MQDLIPRRIDINQKIDAVTVKQFDNDSRYIHVTITDIDLADGDGNAFVLPHRAAGRFTALEPMPGAAASEDRERGTYRVSWRGREFSPDDVLHFRLHADPDQPWRGRGYKIPADRLRQSLLLQHVNNL